MSHKKITRREFLGKSIKFAVSAAAGSLVVSSPGYVSEKERPVVSLIKIKKDNVAAAVEEVIDLLGGINEITKGKDRIMLKPNLMAPSPTATTKPAVIKSLAHLMKKAGKEVFIGEGSAAASPFNVRGGEVFRTKKKEILDKIQQMTFNSLGYTELAKSMVLPLVNLHSGEMVDVDVPDAFVFEKLIIHECANRNRFTLFSPDDENSYSCPGDFRNEKPDWPVSWNSVLLCARSDA